MDYYSESSLVDSLFDYEECLDDSAHLSIFSECVLKCDFDDEWKKGARVFIIGVLFGKSRLDMYDEGGESVIASFQLKLTPIKRLEVKEDTWAME